MPGVPCSTTHRGAGTRQCVDEKSQPGSYRGAEAAGERSHLPCLWMPGAFFFFWGGAILIFSLFMYLSVIDPSVRLRGTGLSSSQLPVSGHHSLPWPQGSPCLFYFSNALHLGPHLDPLSPHGQLFQCVPVSVRALVQGSVGNNLHKWSRVKLLTAFLFSPSAQYEDPSMVSGGLNLWTLTGGPHSGGHLPCTVQCPRGGLLRSHNHRQHLDGHLCAHPVWTGYVRLRQGAYPGWDEAGPWDT